MLSYEKLKAWTTGHKSHLTVGCCFVLVFLLGFGTGKATLPESKPSAKTNYTVKIPEKPAEKQAAEPAKPGTGSCAVKGNGASHIYHVKGGAFYEKLKSPRCFASEDEAKSAGYRRSAR